MSCYIQQRSLFLWSCDIHQGMINTFWKTNPQTTWTGEYQTSPKDLPGRKKPYGNSFCELYVSLLNLMTRGWKIIISSPKPWRCIPSHWKKTPFIKAKQAMDDIFPGDHFFRFHPFWSKGEYFTNGWFPIKTSSWGIPLFTTWNGSVPSIPLITLPAMALCCRLSNFFFAESLSFSQVFSSRTKYLEANFHHPKNCKTSKDSLGILGLVRPIFETTCWGRFLWFALPDKMD